MKKNNIGRILAILIFAVVLSACTANSTISESEDDAAVIQDLPTFTIEELAKYNGKNEMPAYVGYEGKVYDVSKIKAWEDGIHQGKYEAGQDLTEILNNVAPHSPSRLIDNAPLVGILESN